MQKILLTGCVLLLVTACGGDEQNQSDINLLPSAERNINDFDQTCQNLLPQYLNLKIELDHNQIFDEKLLNQQ